MFHGPAELGLLGRVIVFALAVLFGWAAFHRNTRLGRRRKYGPDTTLPIGSAGRVIIFLIAIVLFLLGLGVLK